MKRREDEKFEDYQKRRRVDKIITAMKQAPRVVWNSWTKDSHGDIVGRTFVRGRDTLVNSRSDANRLAALTFKKEHRSGIKPRRKGERHVNTELQWLQIWGLDNTESGLREMQRRRLVATCKRTASEEGSCPPE